MNDNLLSKYYEDFHASRGKYGTVESSERLRFIRTEVGTGQKVIELGCRYGGLLKHFRGGNTVIGVDIDGSALKVCSERLRVSTCLINLNERFPFRDNSFDVVVLSEVLEHMPYPGITLREAMRITRVGGKLVGSVPNGGRLRNRLSFLVSGKIENDPTHIQHFTADSLRTLLSEFYEKVNILPVVGRYVGLSKKLFANYLLFKCVR